MFTFYVKCDKIDIGKNPILKETRYATQHGNGKYGCKDNGN